MLRCGWLLEECSHGVKILGCVHVMFFLYIVFHSWIEFISGSSSLHLVLECFNTDCGHSFSGKIKGWRHVTPSSWFGYDCLSGCGWFFAEERNVQAKCLCLLITKCNNDLLLLEPESGFINQLHYSHHEKKAPPLSPSHSRHVCLPPHYTPSIWRPASPSPRSFVYDTD